MNRFFSYAFAALMFAALSGCETIPASSSEVLAAQTPLICDNKEACDKMWRKASYWISTNSGYKIQTANDAVIETFNAPNYSTTWAYQVTREPLEGTKERIWLRPSCGRVPACSQDPRSMAARFKTYVGN
jgi:hypothetical protein